MSILFSGCSHTVGTDLPDPQLQRYSTLIGERVGKEVVNVAENGASNDWITRSVLEALNDSTEFVYVQFTSRDRIELWKRIGITTHKWVNIIPSFSRNTDYQWYDLAKNWFTHFNTPELGSSNLWRNIYLLENVLTNLNIPHYFFIINRKEDCDNIYKSRSSWKNILCEEDLIGVSLRKEKRHPTVKEHQIIADKLVDKFQRRHYNKRVTTVTSGVTE
tara:strand:+ start:5696 stop:6349 length:654 start_codon:yes stop_codon:yes gene_type:complete